MTAAALRELARALGGDMVGGQVCCPGPNHSPSDRSLAVRPHASMPDGFVVHSIAVTIGAPAAITSCGCSGSRARKVAHVPPLRPLDVRTRRNHGRCKSGGTASTRTAPWSSATLHRASSSSPTTPPASSVSRRLPVDRRSRRAGARPAMVALFRTIGGDEPSAIQRTALRGDATRSTQDARPGVRLRIKVTCDEDVLFRLGVAEGLESAMSANALGQGPSWALGSAGAIRNLPVLPGIETLALIAEHDRANEEAREVAPRAGTTPAAK